MDEEYRQKYKQIIGNFSREARIRGYEPVIKQVFFSNNDAYEFIRELRIAKEEARQRKLLARLEAA